MNLTGDEKRIRALFCELVAEDKAIAPPFERVWPHAPRVAFEPSYTFRRLVLVATSALVLTTVSFLMLLLPGNPGDLIERGSMSPSLASAAKDTKLPPANEKKLPSALMSKPARFITSSNKIVARKRTALAGRDLIMHRAVAISNWQSPTVSFLTYPAQPILSSIPQLDQSVRELRSFLPHNELKEQNQ